MLTLSSKQSADGIWYLTPINDEFEKKYIALRKKEGYLLSVKEVKKLPEASTNTYTWSLRTLTAARFLKYIEKKSSPLTVLELGCGNGWFCNYVSQSPSIEKVFGLDVNQHELKQASQAFGSNSKLQWAYADIFSAELPANSFDLIILNSSVQYFPKLSDLIHLLKKLLKQGGEIHILDSPFYKTLKDQKAAADRSAVYFSSMSFPEMAEHYTPHLLCELEQFKPVIMYRPSFVYTFVQKLKLPRLKTNPFFWFKITN